MPIADRKAPLSSPAIEPSRRVQIPQLDDDAPLGKVRREGHAIQRDDERDVVRPLAFADVQLPAANRWGSDEAFQFRPRNLKLFTLFNSTTRFVAPSDDNNLDFTTPMSSLFESSTPPRRGPR